MTPFYDRDGITIYCGDCLEVMAQLEGPFDAIICDLPYGTTACDWDDVIPLEPLWVEYKRLIKDKGAIVLFGSQPFTSKLVVSNLEWFKYDWIWNKEIPSNHLNVKYQPLKYHEHVLIFSKMSHIYNRQFLIKPLEQRRPNKYITARKRAIKKSAYPKKIYGKMKEGYSNDNSDLRANPKSIITFANPNGAKKQTRLHPTQKPIKLLRYLIRTYTNPGDLILDNTMGSGTTLVAAQIEGRRAVGIDISEEYCQVAVDQLKPPGFLSMLQPSSNNNGTTKGEQLKLI